jgi:hypothetical protein
MPLKGLKRVLPKVRYLVVQCHAAQRPLLTYGIVPIGGARIGTKLTVTSAMGHLLSPMSTQKGKLGL